MSIATEPPPSTPSEPPSRRGPRTPGRHGPGRPAKVWDERLALARADPGTWHKLSGDYSESVAGALRAGRYSGTRRGELETRRQKQPDGRFHVWVRVVAGGAPVVEPDGIDWEDVNEDGVPRHYVDRVEDLPDGSARYFGPLASSNGGYQGEGWQSPAELVASLGLLREAGNLPY